MIYSYYRCNTNMLKIAQKKLQIVKKVNKF